MRRMLTPTAQKGPTPCEILFPIDFTIDLNCFDVSLEAGLAQRAAKNRSIIVQNCQNGNLAGLCGAFAGVPFIGARLALNMQGNGIL